MPDQPRFLLLEDRAADAELIERGIRKHLKTGKFQRVETREAFLAALETFQPDLILADYHLPRFDGLSALQLIQERGLELPFILVSGVMNEDLAVEAMKRGASDYLIKDRLARLGQAVEKALENQRLRLERKQTAEKLPTRRTCLKTSMMRSWQQMRISFSPSGTTPQRRITGTKRPR